MGHELLRGRGLLQSLALLEEAAQENGLGRRLRMLLEKYSAIVVFSVDARPRQETGQQSLR